MAPAAWLLVLALLWAQSLGLWHGVVHEGGYNSAPQVQPSATQAADPNAATATGFFKVLLGNHRDGADCRLFDQLSHGDALASVAMLGLSLAAPAAPVVFVSGLAVVRWLALFQARAPPRVR